MGVSFSLDFTTYVNNYVKKQVPLFLYLIIIYVTPQKNWMRHLYFVLLQFLLRLAYVKECGGQTLHQENGLH